MRSSTAWWFWVSSWCWRFAFTSCRHARCHLVFRSGPLRVGVGLCAVGVRFVGVSTVAARSGSGSVSVAALALGRVVGLASSLRLLTGYWGVSGCLSAVGSFLGVDCGAGLATLRRGSFSRLLSCPSSWLRSPWPLPSAARSPRPVGIALGRRRAPVATAHHPRDRSAPLPPLRIVPTSFLAAPHAHCWSPLGPAPFPGRDAGRCDAARPTTWASPLAPVSCSGRRWSRFRWSAVGLVRLPGSSVPPLGRLPCRGRARHPVCPCDRDGSRPARIPIRDPADHTAADNQPAQRPPTRNPPAAPPSRHATAPAPPRTTPPPTQKGWMGSVKKTV